MSTLTPVKRNNLFTSVIQRSTTTRSVSPTPIRNSTGSPSYEIPLDPKNKFHISYLPGINGYDVDTGSNLEEARLKVVLLTCEVERLTTYNYTLVQENEILRAQSDKTAREKDLETKLAIVLAENEKLNQVIEELYKVFMEQDAAAANREEYEIKINNLMQELDDSKNRYNILEQNNLVELQNKVNEMNQQNQLLADQLAMKDKDLDTLRKRMNALEQLLRENENLNNLVQENLKEINRLREANRDLEMDLQGKEMSINKLQTNEQKKNASHQESQNRVAQLLQANDALQQSIDTLNAQLQQVVQENERLKDRLNRKEADYKTSLEKLSDNIKSLLEENENLNRIILQNSQLSAQSAAQSAALEGENRTLKARLEQSDKYSAELEGKLRDSMFRDQNAEELKSKIILLVNENEKLNNLLRAKNEDIENLRFQLQQAELKLARYNDLALQLQQLSNSNDQLQRLVAEWELKSREWAAEKMRLEGLIAAKDQELGRLNILLITIKGENEEWKRKYADLEASKDNELELEDLRRQFAAIKKLAVEAKEEQQKFSAERMAYETQIYQLHAHINDLENQGALLINENDRLSISNSQNIQVIQELKRNNNQEAQRLETFELKNQLEILKSSTYDIKQALLQAQNEKEAQQRKAIDLAKQNESLASDVAQLKQIIELRKSDTEALAKQNEELRVMCDGLSRQGRFGSNSGVEMEQFNKAKIAELERSRDEYKRQADRNAMDLTRKNRELVEKIQELDVVKLKYEEALANYQALNNQNFARMSMRKY